MFVKVVHGSNQQVRHVKIASLYRQEFCVLERDHPEPFVADILGERLEIQLLEPLS
jgi:hypothetical protein